MILMTLLASLEPIFLIKYFPWKIKNKFKMKLNNIINIGRSDLQNMGSISLRQALPTQSIANIDPFLLLHHYGPFRISDSHNPFDFGPHPHRGFEPITILIEGEQLHRDSLGNEGVVKSGGVQWITAARGIIHSETIPKSFQEKGGVLEGIQLWLNLPAEKKMIAPKYQHAEKEDFKVVSSEDGKVNIQIIAGMLEGINGFIATQSPVNAYTIDIEPDGYYEVAVPNSHQSMIYLIKGDVVINGDEDLKLNENQLIQFDQDGEGFSIKGNTKSKLLFLSGKPLDEPVASYGPYVMNNQTEILEAMRDYQMGKMGFLPA